MIDPNPAEAAALIRAGKLVAFPTETVYGLGANALDPVAVAGIFALKQRPAFDPLIVHVASFQDIPPLTAEAPDGCVAVLAARFWPGPLTIVLRKSHLVPDIVTAGLPTVGIRIPSHPLALDLIRESGCPIAAPSANRFGWLSPTTAAHVRKQLPGVDMVLDGGPCPVGVESTVVAFTGEGSLRVLRPGGVTVEQLREALPRTEVLLDAGHSLPASPGLLESHYAPAKPLHILESMPDRLPEGSGLITHVPGRQRQDAARNFCTAPSGRLVETAAHLFTALHVMEDDPSVRRIFIEPVAEVGLGVAIMDRVTRAAFRWRS